MRQDLEFIRLDGQWCGEQDAQPIDARGQKALSAKLGPVDNEVFLTVAVCFDVRRTAAGVLYPGGPMDYDVRLDIYRVELALDGKTVGTVCAGELLRWVEESFSEKLMDAAV